jgi:ribosomal protein S18 acetylase RimI-like enzyme
VTTTASDSDLVRLEIVDPGHIGDVLDVLTDAAQWLHQRGIDDQWPLRFVDDDYRAARIRDEANRGNVFLVRHPCGLAVATATITDWADPDFVDGWPDGPGDAVYVMRLGVTRFGRESRPGLGALLLLHAMRTAQAREANAVRLDCSKTNTALHRYYERQGFRRVATVDVPNRRSGALFERSLDSGAATW